MDMINVKTIIWKMATWNIKSIQGKESELEDEFEKLEIEILATTETKKKGKGIYKFPKGNIFVYSGVIQEKRAAAGVGCLIQGKLEKQIQSWNAWSERILSVEMKSERNEKKSIIIVYGPNEDDKAVNKQHFWDQLTEAIETAKGRLYIIGDFNSRVGMSDEEYRTVIGKWGENVRNDNGRRMIDFCLVNNLIITNTFFQHKDIHKYTREMLSRNERSIIDYIVIERQYRKTLIDTRVKRGPEIGSDHFVVVSKFKDIEMGKNTTTLSEKKQNETKYETIKSYKLRDLNIAKEFEAEINKNLDYKEMENEDIEHKWNHLKNVMLNAARKVCGIKRILKNKKQTSWWTKEIKQQIKQKKLAWRNYLSNKTVERYNIYKNERTKTKMLIKTAKNEQWEKFGEKMEQDSKTNQKLFYKALKNMRTEKHQDTYFIKNKNGAVITEEEEIIQRWKEYYQELLNAPKEDKKCVKIEIPDDKGIEIGKKELEQVIKELKNGKAPGFDKITTEMMKNIGQKGRDILLHIINACIEKQTFPTDWQKALIVPIFKKGDVKDCNNYRGITLISTAMKILEKIIEKRIRSAIEHTLEESQSGFRKGRSTQDHVFTIKQMTEKAIQEKKKLIVAFLDLEKAFDRAPREIIWKILADRGLNGQILSIIQKIYERNENAVIKSNRVSDTFTTNMGLRQGGSLSPLLFIIYMDEIIKKCTAVSKKVCVGHLQLQRVHISEGAFADDVVLLAGNANELQHNINIWQITMTEMGMKINQNKTKVMVIGENAEDININVNMNEERIEQVKYFQYLGTIIDRSGTQEADINNRIEKTQKLYYAMNTKFISNKEISKETKLKVFKTIYRPVLTFGCESWVLTERQKSKIQATEMKYLRRVRGVTKMDKMRNVDIRKDLEIQPILDYIEERQLQWWGHLQRMNEERPVKKVWKAKIVKNKKRGRPRKSWDNVITGILTKRGKNWNEAKDLTQNREEWKRFVKNT